MAIIEVMIHAYQAQPSLATPNPLAMAKIMERRFFRHHSPGR
jgi:hypothetical protein